MRAEIKKIAAILCLFLATTLPAFCIEDIQSGSSLDSCIKIALKNSPVINDLRYKLQIAGTNVSIAKANYSPTFYAGVGYWQGWNSEKKYDDGTTKWMFPSVSVYLDQLIYDFGKTHAQVDMQKFYKYAAEFRFVDSICNTIYDVKTKYFKVLAAQYEVEIQKNNLEIAKLILDRTKEMYDKHNKGLVDYLNAQIYYDSAKIDLERSYNLYKNALEDLYTSMYVMNTSPLTIRKIRTFDYYEASFTPNFVQVSDNKNKHTNKNYKIDFNYLTPKLPFDLDFAEKEAFENSPDIKALNYTVDGFKKALAYIKKQYYPSLRGQVGYEYNNRYKSIDGRSYNNNQLNVAVTLDSTVNPGKQIFQTKQAGFDVKIAENNVELFKIDLFHQVRKGFIDVETAEKQVRISLDKITTARKNLDIVATSYFSKSKDVSYLDLQLARRNYNEAKIEYIYQLKNYNDALAQLERLTHMHDKCYFEYALDETDRQYLPKALEEHHHSHFSLFPKEDN